MHSPLHQMTTLSTFSSSSSLLQRSSSQHHHIIPAKTRTRTTLRATSATTATRPDPFLLDLADRLEQQSSTTNGAIISLKNRCAEDLMRRSWPTNKDEPFRFTDLSVLKSNAINIAASPTPSLQLQADAQGDGVYELRVVDGVVCSAASLPGGAFAGSLDAVASSCEGLIDMSFQGDVFSSLNGLGARDVGVVSVPEGVKLDKPLHIVYSSSQSHETSGLIVSNPRLIISLGEGAEAEIVEEFVSDTDDDYWINSVLQIRLGKSAKLKHSLVQLQQSLHTKWTSIHQDEASSYELVETSSGGKLKRHNLVVEQLGPETYTELSTFHLAAENETQDLHSRIILNHPKGRCRQLHKCIVTHSTGHAIFDGNIQVNRFAQLSDAGQLSRCLLLAPRATVNVKPNLQIIADDVKCSHGAAISDLEEHQLFYFQTRGIDVVTAKNALIFSFGAEIMEKFPQEYLRKNVENGVKQILATK